MGKKYVIGVDGGNTKTDYFLFDSFGHFVDFVHTGTCSHEALSGSYDETYKVMSCQINSLLIKNSVLMEDVVSGAFGLAGADIPEQKHRLSQIVEKIGFKNYALDNDSFLGIKAGCKSGFGVCSVNGTGTVAGGIDKEGNRLQVGGIGEISGDMAGGSYIARRAIRAVYDSLYRCGPQTLLLDPIMELLCIKDKFYYLQAVSEQFNTRKVSSTLIIKETFLAANKNDSVAISILKEVAFQLAKSAAGCINNLHFDEEVDLVLVGSIWLKAESPLMLEAFKKYMHELSNKTCNFILLTVPPATGAVLWALELANGAPCNEQTRLEVIAAVDKIFRS